MTRDAFTVERNLVVADVAVARDLTVAGIPATSYASIMGQPDAAILGYLDGEPAQVILSPDRPAAAPVNRLHRLGVVVSIHPELLDRRP